MINETFDVFLSHNSKDKPAVRQLADALEGRKIRVWLDERELIPGRPWLDELDHIVRTVRSAAVLVGKDGLGPWEIPEMRALLVQMVKRDLRVIPVLLPGAPKAPDLPVILAELTWVDLREGITEQALGKLQWGITKEKPPKDGQILPSSPRFHNLPFSSIGDLFKGRDEELRKLQEGQATAITQAQMIYGLGGIGKTRLAVEYAWRSGHLYDAAFFVLADSAEALHSGLANLARPSLLKLPEYRTVSQEETVAAVLSWLRNHDRWLLILDNVDTEDAEQEVLKIVPSLSTGRALITSRIKDWPASIRRQQIETLSLNEAQRFILERTADGRNQSEDDPSQAFRLAKELDGLPLILEQAAAYIVKHQISLSDYMKQWEREREEVLNWFDALLLQYPVSVAVTWQKTFRNLHPIAAVIMRIMAHFAPDPIPPAIFKERVEIVNELVKLFCEEAGTSLDDSSIQGIPHIQQAIAEVTHYCMVTLKGELLIVHRIVQNVFLYRIPKERQRDWIERSLRLVKAFSPSKPSDENTWRIWDIMRPHATQILQYADAAGITDHASGLMNQLSSLLYSRGFYQEAEPLMRRALQIDESSFGAQHPKVAIRLNNLAQLLQVTNRLVEAEPLMRRALQIDEDFLGPQHPKVAIRLSNLAQLLQTTGRWIEAESLMRRALQISEDSFASQHPKVAIRLSNLAQLLQATDRLTEAEPLTRRALEILKVNLGTEHPDTRIAQRNLDLLFQKITAQSAPPSSPEEAQA